MTTPREDAIAARMRRVLETIIESDLLDADEWLWLDKEVRAALGAEAETPDRSADPYWRGYSDGLHAALGKMPVVGAEAETPDLVLVRKDSGGVFPDGTTNHPPIDFDNDFARHPFTCGICKWGRDGAYHDEAEYLAHMEKEHG